MEKQRKKWVLIGVVEDSDIGVAPCEVVIAVADEKESLEEILDQDYDDELLFGFESRHGNIYLVSEVRIEWVQ
jgi:hypothetical protein